MANLPAETPLSAWIRAVEGFALAAGCMATAARAAEAEIAATTPVGTAQAAAVPTAGGPDPTTWARLPARGRQSLAAWAWLSYWEGQVQRASAATVAGLRGLRQLAVSGQEPPPHLWPSDFGVLSLAGLFAQVGAAPVAGHAGGGGSGHASPPAAAASEAAASSGTTAPGPAPPPKHPAGVHVLHDDEEDSGGDDVGDGASRSSGQTAAEGSDPGSDDAPLVPPPGAVRGAGRASWTRSGWRPQPGWRTSRAAPARRPRATSEDAELAEGDGGEDTESQDAQRRRVV